MENNKKEQNNNNLTTREEHTKHNRKSIYFRDDHCDWGSSGMKDIAEDNNDSK